MTRRTEYRLFFNNQPATRDQLDGIESITVEQEVDMAWEARLEVPICLDRRGRWTGTDEPFMRPFSRVRVEISLRDDTFVPLIDGPVIKINSQMQFQPGESALTLIINDDSFYMNRDEGNFSFDNGESDYEIIDNIFTSCEQIHDLEIDDDLRDTEGDPVPFSANGTAMQVLTDLARTYGRHAYVLPGEDPGQSRGCFKDFPGLNDRQTDRLPPMVLLGPDANIRNHSPNQDIVKPVEAFFSTVQILDKSIVTNTASSRESELLGDRSAMPEGETPSRRMLRPNPFMRRGISRAVFGRANSSSYLITARGETIEGCYRGVLRPYQLVTVMAGETSLSVNYVITQVTHTLTRSAYSQSFSLKSNAVSEIDSENLANLRSQIS